MLDQEFIKKMQEKLEKHLAHINREMEEIATKNEDGNWIPKFVDWGDQWDESAEEQAAYEERLSYLRNIISIKAKIEHALDRINKGTYGLCDNCDGEISKERLEALPEASKCLNCQS
jgi:RNA polymerase-binding transcription factor DksA